jgi:hypothetical protein
VRQQAAGRGGRQGVGGDGAAAADLAHDARDGLFGALVDGLVGVLSARGLGTLLLGLALLLLLPPHLLDHGGLLVHAGVESHLGLGLLVLLEGGGIDDVVVEGVEKRVNVCVDGRCTENRRHGHARPHLVLVDARVVVGKRLRSAKHAEMVDLGGKAGLLLEAGVVVRGLH